MARADLTDALSAPDRGPRSVVAALAGGGVPEGLAPERRAVVEAVDAVAARRSIPADVQARVVAAFVPERRAAARGAGLGDKFDPALTSTQVASACRTRGSASRRQSTAPTGLRGRATTSPSST
jgi:hypothetical protein